KDMCRPLEQLAGESDRIAHTTHLGHGPGAQRPSLHDRRIELDTAGEREHGAPAGVEQRIVLECDHRGLDGLECAAAALENALAATERLGEAAAAALRAFRTRLAFAARAGAPVYCQCIHTGGSNARLARASSSADGRAEAVGIA